MAETFKVCCVWFCFCFCLLCVGYASTSRFGSSLFSSFSELFFPLLSLSQLLLSLSFSSSVCLSLSSSDCLSLFVFLFCLPLSLLLCFSISFCLPFFWREVFGSVRAVVPLSPHVQWTMETRVFLQVESMNDPLLFELS